MLNGARYTGYRLNALEETRHKLIGPRIENPADLADPATRAEAALGLSAPLLGQPRVSAN